MMEAPVKEGVLYLQIVKFGKKSWRRMRTMLYQASASGIGRLELWDVRDGGLGSITPKPALRRGDRRVIRLADCLSVEPAPEESCPPSCTAFHLNTTHRNYMLAMDVCEDWMQKLCLLAFQRNDEHDNWPMRSRSEEVPMSENELYSSWKTVQYKVTVLRTEAAVRCSLSGCYLLSLGQHAISLLDITTSQAVYSWPYQLLRRFGQDKEGVTIEAGRRCHSGEGHFTFLSKNVNQIYSAIENAILQQSVPSREPKAALRRPAATVDLSCKRKNNVTHLPGYTEKNTSLIPPRNVFSPDALSKSPVQQPNNFLDESDATMYATINELAEDGQVPTFPKTQASPPPLPQRRNEQVWEEEQAEYETEEEERLCSLESLCLSDTMEGICPDKSSLYYNLRGPLEEAEVDMQQDCCDTKCLNSTFNFQRNQNRDCLEDSRCGSQGDDSVVTTTEMPVDFKQRLSNLLFKDMAKMQPQLCIKYTDTAKAVNNQDKKQELYNQTKPLTTKDSFAM